MLSNVNKVRLWPPEFVETVAVYVLGHIVGSSLFLLTESVNSGKDG
jgi:hypothetical protein